ncbi:MAG: hypothetical protein NZ519_03625 [Bacteroidia bacterium]|nr:hypothetical protein [Bacteroidia bacterium]
MPARAVRSAAKYRSVSVVRNAPPLALARGTPKKINLKNNSSVELKS